MNNKKRYKHIGKLMSLALRHNPKVLNLALDENGWVTVDQLLHGLNAKGKEMDFDTLKDLVETNDKQRYIFNEDQTKIRANQGHSIKVDLELVPVEPPELLYHGTVQKFMDSIQKSGLQKQTRQHVHLSKDLETATNVGSRRGKPVILKIEALKMHQAGYKFYCSENSVWLTDAVPTNFIV